MQKRNDGTPLKLSCLRAIPLVLWLILQTGCEFTKTPATVVAVTASSNMFPEEDARYSPQYLMEGEHTWHAKSPLEFPQWIEVAYSSSTKITHVGIMSQDDSPTGNEHTRGPKDFIFQGSNDRANWKDLLTVSDNVYTQGGEWKEWDIQNEEKYVYYRIYITACNNPDILSIRQIQLTNPEK